MSDGNDLLEYVQYLGYVATAIISAIAGAVMKKKPSEVKTPCPALKVSSKTGGAYHISEEGLSKIKDLEETVMTEKAHGTVCNLAQTEMKLYISKQFQEQTAIIIKAIKKELKED